MIQNPHPLEVGFLVAALTAAILNGVLFTLKLNDLFQVRKAGQNGPILFLSTEKIRHQGFMLAISSGMTMLAISGVNNQAALTAQVLNLLSGGIAFALAILGDALFIFYRRRKMAILVAEYSGVPGGKRKTDPQS